MSSAAMLSGLSESKHRDSSHLAAIRQRQCAAGLSIGSWISGWRAQDLAYQLSDFSVDEQADVIGRNCDVANPFEVGSASWGEPIALSGHRDDLDTFGKRSLFEVAQEGGIGQEL